jgi:Rap/ran-GAP
LQVVDVTSLTFLFADFSRQVIFHVASLMESNPETDPQFTTKKRHVGNDDVVIVWCEPPRTSSTEYKMSTRDSVDFHLRQVKQQQDRLAQLTTTALSGQFCNIVIAVTPLSDGPVPQGSPMSALPGFRIDVFRKPEYRSIRFGPVGKSQVVSEAALAPVVRATALHADIAVRSTRDQRQVMAQEQQQQQQHSSDSAPSSPVPTVSPPLSHVQERERQIKGMCARFAGKGDGSDVFSHV